MGRNLLGDQNQPLRIAVDHAADFLDTIGHPVSSFREGSRLLSGRLIRNIGLCDEGDRDFLKVLSN